SIGWATLVVTCLGLGQRLPRPPMLGEAPWWMWLGGGAVGAFFVTTALIVAPRIGAAYWVALIVAGQMGASMLLDHHGWLGFAKRPIDLTVVFGALLVVAGVALISYGKARANG
ncbi:MAG TPA: DMT family transporter, partial [Polyangiaceae bacterium LLY-WYZ-15_(1-7)]|nr:DMT family transporter [Polyangiaceae bacterium LLY-WYZ-15_(1-7)]